MVTSDISRSDNQQLAQAASDMAQTFATLFQQFPAQRSGTLARLALRLVLKFAGEPQDDAVLDDILAEAGLANAMAAARPSENEQAAAAADERPAIGEIRPWV